MSVRIETSKHTRKAGLPPGTLVHTGEESSKSIRLSLMDYDSHELREIENADLDQCLAMKDSPSVSWINIDGVHDVKALRIIGKGFGLHPLVMEDILNTSQRPKLEDYGDYLYLVFEMLSIGDDRVCGEQVSLVLGKNYILSFQEADKPGDVFTPIRSRLRTGAGRIRKRGADFLAYSLLDAVVDNYFIVLEQLGDRIETLEDRLLDHPQPSVLQDFHGLRGQLILLRRSVWPLREVVSTLKRGETDLVTEVMGVYLRDLYDHVVHVIDTAETLREMLSAMLEMYLSSVSYRMGEVMKVLTVIATVFIPLTFLVGVYGMNFAYMPELHWRFAYPVLWLVMLTVAGLMFAYFRRKRWM